MISAHWRRILAPFLLSLLLLVAACAEPPSRFDQVQQETAGQTAVSEDAVAGGQFNKFFPESAGGFEVVPAQEKQGFAEYKLNRDGTNVAMLSVNDTISNPGAATKFQSSTRQIGGYPALDIGNTQTAVLVSERFQVKVQSRDPSFTASDREDWLSKFDLNGIAGLQ
jgi:hypothetical protein